MLYEVITNDIVLRAFGSSEHIVVDYRCRILIGILIGFFIEVDVRFVVPGVGWRLDIVHIAFGTGIIAALHTENNDLLRYIRVASVYLQYLFEEFYRLFFLPFVDIVLGFLQPWIDPELVQVLLDKVL